MNRFLTVKELRDALNEFLIAAPESQDSYVSTITIKESTYLIIPDLVKSDLMDISVIRTPLMKGA